MSSSAVDRAGKQYRCESRVAISNRTGSLEDCRAARCAFAYTIIILPHNVAGMSESETLDSRYSWTRLGITLAIAVLGNVGMWSIIVIMPAVQAEFAVARADASLPYTLTMIGFALGNLVIGRAVDRFGVTIALIGSALTMAAGFGLAAHCLFKIVARHTPQIGQKGSLGQNNLAFDMVWVGGSQFFN